MACFQNWPLAYDFLQKYTGFLNSDIIYVLWVAVIAHTSYLNCLNMPQTLLLVGIAYDLIVYHIFSFKELQTQVGI